MQKLEFLSFFKPKCDPKFQMCAKDGFTGKNYPFYECSPLLGILLCVKSAEKNRQLDKLSQSFSDVSLIFDKCPDRAIPSITTKHPTENFISHYKIH